MNKENNNTVQVNTKKLQLATFAAGCFWGVEESFQNIKGVKSTVVGYTGGWFKNPTYRDVCTGKTGHAEAIQVEFDPNEVSKEDLENSGKLNGRRIVTEIVPAAPFYKAEQYHQKYYQRGGGSESCWYS